MNRFLTRYTHKYRIINIREVTLTLLTSYKEWLNELHY